MAHIVDEMMDFINDLVGTNDDDSTEFRLIEAGMKLATFFVLALILYMFTQLLLK